MNFIIISGGSRKNCREEVNIMMKLTCKAMGADCGYEVTGENAEEVKSEMMNHAMSEHVDMMGSMTEGEKEDMMRKMDEKMVEV